jgi:hypothetical protein
MASSRRLALTTNVAIDGKLILWSNAAGAVDSPERELSNFVEPGEKP